MNIAKFLKFYLKKFQKIYNKILWYDLDHQTLFKSAKN